jgi:hypothetical protein
MGIILGPLMFIAVAYALGYLVVLMRNGFNFRRTHEQIQIYNDQQRTERRMRRAKRKARSGWWTTTVQ